MTEVTTGPAAAKPRKLGPCLRLPRGASKEDLKVMHRMRMDRRKAMRAARHADYLRSKRAKQVAQWAAWVRTHWHKSIWPAAKVERRAARAGA